MNNNLADAILSLSLFDVLKWFFVGGLVMYMAFAIVIVRQVGVMSEALEDPNNAIIAAFAWLHLGMTVLLLIISIILL